MLINLIICYCHLCSNLLIYQWTEKFRKACLEPPCFVPVDWEKPSICFVFRTTHVQVQQTAKSTWNLFGGILDKSKKAGRAANKVATDWGNLIWRANGQTVKFANKWAFGLWAIPSYLSGRKIRCPSNIWLEKVSNLLI